MKEAFLKTPGITNVNIRRCLRLFVLFALIIALPIESHAGAKRVGILPLKINAEQNLSFLRDGIQSMLSSRLSWDDKIIVSGLEETAAALATVEDPLDERKVRMIGNRLTVDYVLFGSLTLLGNSMSIDVKVVDLTGDAPVRSFFKQSSDMDGIIPQVSRLAEEINEKVFGRISARQPLPGKTIKERSSIHAHPEQLMSGKPVDAEPQPIRAQENKHDVPPAAAVPMVQRSTGPSAQFWKSRGLDMRIRGLALGDVDGDGKIETVVISSQKLIVYRLDDRRFYKTGEIEGKRYQQYVAVDVADINQNRRSEIFVTVLNSNSGGLESFVLEWNGNSFIPITGLERWYFRVQNDPKRGLILLGQRRSHGSLFGSNVHELTWSSNGYISQQKVRLPGGVNIFEFARGNLLNNDSEAILTFDDEDHLRIYSLNSQQQWKSDDRYSGSEQYLERVDNPERLTYLPHRLLLTDLNGDGKIEVILVNNQGTTGRYFKRYRRYNSGLFESLSWDGLGLSPAWQTRKISGYISDYALQDIDNDGRLELVAAIVSQRGNLIKRARSSIIAFDMESLIPAR